MQRTANIMGTLQSLAASDPDMKFLAQKAFIAYVKSVYLQRNKDVFDVHALPLTDYAAALGLPGEPKIKFLSKNNAINKATGNEHADAAALAKDADKVRLEAHKKKNKSFKLQQLKEKIKREKEKRRQLRAEGKSENLSGQLSSDDDMDEDAKKKPSRRTEEGKLERMLSRKNDGVLSSARERVRGSEEVDDSDDILVLKRKIPYTEDEDANEDVLREFYTSQVPKKIRKSGHGKNKKIKFDEEGNPVSAFERLVAEKSEMNTEDTGNLYIEDVKTQSELYAEKIRQRLAQESAADKERNRLRIQEKRLKRKEKMRELKEESLGQGAVVSLGGGGDDSGSRSSNSSSSDSDSSSSSGSSSSSDSDDE